MSLLDNYDFIKMINECLTDKIAQHVSWFSSITKDVCYTGKVLKIVATNQSKQEPVKDTTLDFRYKRESIVFCIPMQNHDDIQEFNDYINTQLNLVAKTINEVLTNDAK